MLECYFLTPNEERFAALFHSVDLGGLESFYPLDHHNDKHANISLYLTFETTALLYFRILIFHLDVLLVP